MCLMPEFGWLDNWRFNVKEIKDKNDLALVEKLQAGYKSIREQLSKAIIGQDEVIEKLMIALF